MPEVQPQPQFKVFYGRGSRPPDSPAISIHRRGDMLINEAAYEQMGKPVAIELSFDETLKIVGLRPLQERLAHAYPVSENGKGRAYGISSIAFCYAIGVDLTKARRYTPVRYAEVFGINLTAPVAVTSPVRTQRPDPPGIRTRGK